MDVFKPRDEKAVDSIAELFKIVVTTSGIILVLLWRLITKKPSLETLFYIRIASVVMAVSMALSLLGLQFIVSALQREEKDVSKVGSITFCFLLTWIGFLLGCIFLILAIFNFY